MTSSSLDASLTIAYGSETPLKAPAMFLSLTALN